MIFYTAINCLLGLQVLTNISSRDVKAEIGESVNLLCSAEGEPPVSFRWEKDKKATKSFTQIENPYHGSFLLVKIKDQSGFGEYICSIRDRFETVSYTIRVWKTGKLIYYYLIY